MGMRKKSEQLFNEIERGTMEWKCFKCRKTATERSIVLCGSDHQHPVSQHSSPVSDGGISIDIAKLENAMADLNSKVLKEHTIRVKKVEDKIIDKKNFKYNR